MLKTFYKIALLAVLYIFFPLTLSAQTVQENIYQKIEGYWEGAFIKENAFQGFDIQFYKTENNINSLQIIKEWHPQFGEFEIPVEIDSTGRISFNTGHGRAVVQIDSTSLELVGKIENSLPSIYVHFKKVPSPPMPAFEVLPVSIQNGGIELNGHLHKPKFQNSETVIIIVGGRSCYAGSTKYDLYGKLLRAYGISVLSYQKRGTGKSTGNCDKATITDLADDVNSIRQYLAKRPEKFKNFGLLGSSAGGWVIAKAAETGNYDFLISIVGPSTSVFDQQMQSMAYGVTEFNIPEKAKEDLLEYTRMMFEAKSTQENFKRFQELLKKSKEDGWFELLDNTDIPPSAAGIEDLWVRRHNYDPFNSLSEYNGPILAIYGEKDWIVPCRENVSRLEEIFRGDRSTYLKTVIARNAGHSTETEKSYITLGNNTSYWRFFRISPQVNIEIISFLRSNGLIKE